MTVEPVASYLDHAFEREDHQEQHVGGEEHRGRHDDVRWVWRVQRKQKAGYQDRQQNHALKLGVLRDLHALYTESSVLVDAFEHPAAPAGVLLQ